MKHRLSASILVLASAISLLLVIFTKQAYSQQTNESTHAIEHPRATTPTSGSVEIECDPACVRKQSSEVHQQNRFAGLIYRTLDDPVALWTGLLALATFALGGLVAYQISDARRSNERQLRAYISIEANPDDTPIFDYANGLRIPLRMYNRGQTPAYKISQWIDTEILETSVAHSEEELRGSQRTGAFSTGILGPGAWFGIHGVLARAIRSEEKNDLAEGNKRIFLFGEISYRDAFEHERTTKFKLMVLINKSGGSRGIQICSTGNDAT